MTTVRTINNQMQAVLLLSFLHDKEILAVLTDQYSNAAEFAPIRLQVPDQQAERRCDGWSSSTLRPRCRRKKKRISKSEISDYP